jgi:hypothetical protein
VFTPGDNDWTDCDRPANGGFSSLERLNYERLVFFNTPFSLGRRRMRQEVQTGNNDVQWLKILVTPRSREVFAYEPQIVPANRTAVPAP